VKARRRPGGGLGVEAKQGAAAAHRVTGQVVPDGEAVRVLDLGCATRGPTHEGITIEQAHGSRGSPGELARAVRDSLHDRLEVEAYVGELMLHGNGRAEDGDVHRPTPA
jgi:hypothetical protein